MPEILHVPDEVVSSRSLAAPGAVLDPATAAVVEAAVAEAEARGRRDGEAAGRQEAVQAAERAAATVRASLDLLTQELAEQRELAATADLEVVRSIAQVVLERTPPDDAMQVLDRVRHAVELLDADRLQVRLHPSDHELLAAHVDDDRLELVADPTIAAGDAVVGTSVAGAILTRRALLDAALRALAEEAGA